MKLQDSFSKAEILEGLDLGQFVVHYQPIIDKAQDCVISGEALVRWNHPELGFLHPKSFIGVAEETGAIAQIGEFVLRESCKQSKIWKDEGHTFYRIAVNISLAQLTDWKFQEKVFRILSEAGVDPGDIELEVTESMAMADPETTQETLLKLKSFGMKIYIDDFGTGYSSLSHLQHFPLDGLKIDGRFVQQALYSDRDENLMHAIILLGKTLELDVVAEGVETDEQMELLRSLDCHVMQGFYFTHALPADEYKEWCRYFAEHPQLRM
jgi:EAL domain-containing protein (putative c-di-GMP-specific phosphodiesterase class I)